MTTCQEHATLTYVKSLEKRIKKNEKDIDFVEGQIKEIRFTSAQALDTANGVSTALNAFKIVVEGALLALAFTIDGFKKLASDINGRFDNLEARVSGTESNIKILFNSIDIIFKRILTLEGLIDSIKRRVSSIEQSLSFLQQALFNVLEKIKIIEFAITQINELIDSITITIVNLNDRISSIENNIKNIRIAIQRIFELAFEAISIANVANTVANNAQNIALENRKIINNVISQINTITGNIANLSNVLNTVSNKADEALNIAKRALEEALKKSNNNKNNEQDKRIIEAENQIKKFDRKLNDSERTRVKFPSEITKKVEKIEVKKVSNVTNNTTIIQTDPQVKKDLAFIRNQMGNLQNKFNSGVNVSSSSLTKIDKGNKLATQVQTDKIIPIFVNTITKNNCCSVTNQNNSLLENIKDIVEQNNLLDTLNNQINNDIKECCEIHNDSIFKASANTVIAIAEFAERNRQLIEYSFNEQARIGNSLADSGVILELAFNPILSNLEELKPVNTRVNAIITGNAIDFVQGEPLTNNELINSINIDRASLQNQINFEVNQLKSQNEETQIDAEASIQFESLDPTLLGI